MSDLRERLRRYQWEDGIFAEAADEIERLTEVEAVCIARWRGQEEEIERLHECLRARDELNAKFQAEIERLKELLDQSHQQGFSDGCLAEREACARVAESWGGGMAEKIAAAIRARKDHE